MIFTYLIGNGFDLGIGLKTGFSHFLEYYINTFSSLDDVVDFKEEVKQDTIELWANFEKKFGEYIANFNDDTLKNYITIYENILYELNAYLITENDKFADEISKEVAEQIIDWLGLFDLQSIGFRPDVKERFYKITEYNKSTLDVNYYFLSFNYTNTLDKIINKIITDTNSIIYSHNFNGTVATRKIHRPIHIHGELNGNMIMGVNDFSQLPFSGNLTKRAKRRLIKPEKNKAIGYQIDETSEKYISNSSIICIYGMSIGETDKVWWKRIGKWLIKNESKALIYFVQNDNIKKDTVYAIDRIIDAEEDYCEKLLDALNIPKEKRETLRDKVFIIINSKFMQINMVKELSANQE